MRRPDLGAAAGGVLAEGVCAGPSRDRLANHPGTPGSSSNPARNPACYLTAFPCNTPPFHPARHGNHAQNPCSRAALRRLRHGVRRGRGRPAEVLRRGLRRRRHHRALLLEQGRLRARHRGAGMQLDHRHRLVQQHCDLRRSGPAWASPPSKCAPACCCSYRAASGRWCCTGCGGWIGRVRDESAAPSTFQQRHHEQQRQSGEADEEEHQEAGKPPAHHGGNESEKYGDGKRGVHENKVVQPWQM